MNAAEIASMLAEDGAFDDDDLNFYHAAVIHTTLLALRTLFHFLARACLVVRFVALVGCSPSGPGGEQKLECNPKSLCF